MGREYAVFTSLAILTLISCASAGPVNRLSRGTSDLRSSNETVIGCSLGDLVYLPGDDVPGRSICETCSCGEDGAVRCTKAVCQTKPGCKALHTPDVCCPTYHCECEKDGRMYANGEKLIDPVDPCRVCYCQGGEVVCRHIACFKRDDCEPRKVSGRCCPEYDHCPLGGVSTDRTTTTKILTTTFHNNRTESKEPLPDEYTIESRETFSSILSSTTAPRTTGIKIKELVPINLESREIQKESTKNPPFPRETSDFETKTTSPVIQVGDQLLIIAPDKVDLEKLGISTPASVITVVGAEGLQRGDLDEAVAVIAEQQKTSEIIQAEEIISTFGEDYKTKPTFEMEDKVVASESIQDNVKTQSVHRDESTKRTIEKSESRPYSNDDEVITPEHNPEFPPLPDDLSGVDNVEEDNEEDDQFVSEKSSVQLAKRPVFSINKIEITSKHPDVVSEKLETNITLETTANPSSLSHYGIKTGLSKLMPDDSKSSQSSFTEEYEQDSTTEYSAINFETGYESSKSISMLPNGSHQTQPIEVTNDSSENLEKYNIEIIDVTQPQQTDKPQTAVIVDSAGKTAMSDLSSTATESNTTEKNAVFATAIVMDSSYNTKSNAEDVESKTPNSQETHSTTADKLILPLDSKIEVKLLGNTPVADDETSFKTSHFEEEPKDADKTEEPLVKITRSPQTIEKKESAKATQTKAVVSQFPTGNRSLISATAASVLSTEYVETETIKSIKNTGKEKSDIIQQTKHKNVLTVLKNLVGDVASIDEQTKNNKKTNYDPHSEEFIPVSKSSNKKVQSTKGSKNKNTGKFTEIHAEDSDGIISENSPNDKAEPTTKRPTIDNVSDVTISNFKPNHEIEIINKAYVPTMKRPNKIMKKNSEKVLNDEDDMKNEEIQATEENLYKEQSSRGTEGATSYLEGTGINKIEDKVSKIESLESSTILQ